MEEQQLDLHYGKTPEEVQTLAKLAFSYKGLVLGRSGRGGSGVMVSMRGFRGSVLTARHVVLDCLLSGELTAARSNMPGTFTKKPDQIICLGPHDSAVLSLKQNDPSEPSLEQAAWMSTTPALQENDPVLVFGTPGTWKDVNLQNQRCDSRVLPYWTHVVGEVQEGRPFVCEVDDNPGLPETLAGMSGGALHGADGRFLGINIEELEGAFRRVRVLPSSCLGVYRHRLGRPQIVPYRVSSRNVVVEYRAEHRDGYKTRVSAFAEVLEPKVRVASGASYRPGRGRLLKLRILVPEMASRYPITTDVRFEWNPDDPGDPWLEPLGEEVARMLGAGGLRVITVEPTIVQKTVSVRE